MLRAYSDLYTYACERGYAESVSNTSSYLDQLVNINKKMNYSEESSKKVTDINIFIKQMHELNKNSSCSLFF